jgi:hypothetical protein
MREASTCTTNGRSRLAWLKVCTKKVRGMKKGFEKEGCPLCRGEEDVFTDCIKMYHDEEVAYKRMINYCCRIKEYGRIFV